MRVYPVYRLAVAAAAVVLLVIFLNKTITSLNYFGDKMSSKEIADLVDNTMVCDDIEGVDLNHAAEGYYDEVLLQLELETA